MAAGQEISNCGRKCLCEMFVSRIVSDKRGEGDQGIGLFCTAAASIPSVQCAESPARLSGCVTDRDTLYWALVDGGDLQPIAIAQLTRRKHQTLPRVCLASIGREDG